MTTSERMPRVNEAIRHALAMLFEKMIVPDFPNALITIMDVQTALDLHDAIVRVSIMAGTRTGDEVKRKVMNRLQEERAKLQHELAKKVPIKYTPRLDFRLDETSAKSASVLATIHEMELAEKKGADDAHDA